MTVVTSCCCVLLLLYGVCRSERTFTKCLSVFILRPIKLRPAGDQTKIKTQRDLLQNHTILSHITVVTFIKRSCEHIWLKYLKLTGRFHQFVSLTFENSLLLPSFVTSQTEFMKQWSFVLPGTDSLCVFTDIWKIPFKWSKTLKQLLHLSRLVTRLRWTTWMRQRDVKSVDHVGPRGWFQCRICSASFLTASTGSVTGLMKDWLTFCFYRWNSSSHWTSR